MISPQYSEMKLVLGREVLDEDSPPRDVRGRHEQPLADAALHQHVPARDLGHVVLVGAALFAQVGVALPDGEEAWALLGVALGLAPAAGKPVGALGAALAKLLAKVL